MGKAKKVLFTSHTANFHKFNRPFMRMLKEQGYTVHYASAGEEKVYDTDKHFDVPFERSPFKFGNVKAYFKLKKIIDREKYDLIHTHTPMGSVVTRLAARDARKKGTRVIYTAHGFHFFKGAPLLNWIVYYPIEKFMARHTDTLITINEEDYGLAKANFKTNVLYSHGVGIDTSKFRKNMTKVESTAYRKTIGLKAQDFVLINVAELLPRKNQLWLISNLESFLRKYKNVKVLFVGSDSLNGECQKLVNDLALNDQVYFLGYRNDISNLNMISNLAISASKQEGLAIYQLEALAVGLPVLGTKIRGHIEEIEKYKLNDSVEFNQALEKLYAKLPSGSLPIEYSLERVLKSHSEVYGL